MINRLLEAFRFYYTGGHTERAKLSWLVRLRWGAVALFSFFSGPAFLYGYLDRTTFVVYVGLIALLFLFNLITHLLFVEGTGPIGPLFVGYQLAVDLVVLTILTFLTGGFENPLVLMFVLNAGIGGILIRDRNSWPFVALCHVLLASLQVDHALNFRVQMMDRFETWVFASHLFIFLAWFVMRSLGHHLDTQFESLTTSRVQSERHVRLRAIGSLAAGFSHEFASPLQSAKIYLDRARRQIERPEGPDLLKGELSENLQEASESLRRCEEVIRAMNSSQLDIREQQFKMVWLDELIRDILESWREENPEARLVVQQLPRVHARLSPINFAHVLINLLDNAFEAGPHGDIILHGREANGRIQLVIEDEGSGFDQRVLDRRGEPFVTTKEKGTGLGLYVSDLFLQSLSGELRLSNRIPASGARVVLDWPRLGPVVAREAR